MDSPSLPGRWSGVGDLVDHFCPEFALEQLGGVEAVGVDVRIVVIADLFDLDRFADDVTAWTGNPCAVVEYSAEEISELVAGDGRLARDLRTDGIALTEQRVALLRNASSTR